jgi:hypothetical protein
MSKTRWVAGLAIGLGTLTFSAPSQASTLLFDQSVSSDILFGSGNGNGSFTIDQNNGVELGLRAKVRFDDITNLPTGTYNSNGDGSYSHSKGEPPDTSPPKPGWWVGRQAARWNFEWSINSDYLETLGRSLGDLVYELGIDSDPSAGESFSVFDPVNSSGAQDHGIGNNSTANGAGDDDNPRTDPEYATLIANNNVAQNSWNMEFFDAFSGLERDLKVGPVSV